MRALMGWHIKYLAEYPTHNDNNNENNNNICMWRNLHITGICDTVNVYIFTCGTVCVYTYL